MSGNVHGMAMKKDLEKKLQEASLKQTSTPPKVSEITVDKITLGSSGDYEFEGYDGKDLVRFRDLDEKGKTYPFVGINISSAEYEALGRPKRIRVYATAERVE